MIFAVLFRFSGGDRIMKRNFSILFILTTVLVQGICAAAAWSADGIVQADSLRSAVIDTMTAYAGREGLKLDISVPVVANVLVKDVDEPRIAVNLAGIEQGKSNVRVPVDLLASDGTVARSIAVIARVRRFATVAVAATDIPRGDRITVVSVVYEEADITEIAGYLDEKSEMPELQAKRSIRKGMVLSEANIEQVPLIRRGDKVIMKVCVGSVVLTARGVARENGGMNEVIRVYNETTKKTLDCRVLDTKTVIVGG